MSLVAPIAIAPAGAGIRTVATQNEREQDRKADSDGHFERMRHDRVEKIFNKLHAVLCVRNEALS